MERAVPFGTVEPVVWRLSFSLFFADYFGGEELRLPETQPLIRFLFYKGKGDTKR